MPTGITFHVCENYVIPLKDTQNQILFLDQIESKALNYFSTSFTFGLEIVLNLYSFYTLNMAKFIQHQPFVVGHDIET